MDSCSTDGLLAMKAKAVRTCKLGAYFKNGTDFGRIVQSTVCYRLAPGRVSSSAIDCGKHYLSIA
jgi:hypothetical protein